MPQPPIFFLRVSGIRLWLHMSSYQLALRIVWDTDMTLICKEDATWIYPCSLHQSTWHCWWVPVNGMQFSEWQENRPTLWSHLTTVNCGICSLVTICTWWVMLATDWYQSLFVCKTIYISYPVAFFSWSTTTNLP